MTGFGENGADTAQATAVTAAATTITTVNDYDYTYNGGQLTGEVITTTVDGTVTNTETLYYYYDASGTPVSVKYNNTLYFYVTNLQGDVLAIMNGSGTIVVEYTYDAWGYIRNTTGSMATTLGKANALRYRGYVYDTETALYYLQSRYYNPGTGRFINADVLVATGQGLLGNNMFAYCNNNPVNSYDSSGYAPHNIFMKLEEDPAETYQVEVLVLSIGSLSWMETSNTMGADLAAAVGAESYMVVAVTDNNLGDIWNNTTAAYVIIHTHGSPGALSGEGDAYFRYVLNDLAKLEHNSNIQYVLITACQTGADNGHQLNVGQLLSKKINSSGLVVCSTTTVEGYDLTFTAKDGGRWIIYSNGVHIRTIRQSEIVMKYYGTSTGGTR